MGVIFDLDETLVNTIAAEKELEEERFQDAEMRIPEFSLYPGMIELLNFIDEHEIKIAVVSTSPKDYCEKVLQRFDINCGCIVGKGDTAEKPSPEPMLKALQLLSLTKDRCVSFGDRSKDMDSSTKAGIRSIGCLWGHEGNELKKSKAAYFISEPVQAIPILKELFSI